MDDQWLLKILWTRGGATLSRAGVSVSRASSPHVRTGFIVLSGSETSNLLALFAMQSNCTLLDLSSSRASRRCQDAWRDGLEAM